MRPPAGPITAFSSAYLEILEVGQLGLCDAASGWPEDGLQLCIQPLLLLHVAGQVIQQEGT